MLISHRDSNDNPKMYHIETHKIIHQITAIFLFFGMWQNDDESILRKTLKKLIHLILAFSFVAANATGAIFTDNIEESVFLAALSVLFLVGFVRLTFVLRKKKEILTFLQNIGVHSITDYRLLIETKKKLANFTIMSYSLIFMMTAGVFLPPISCLPIFSNERRLPFNIGFPLNWRASEIVYWIALMFIEFGLFFCATATLVVPQLWYLMLNYSVKYRMLGSDLKTLGLKDVTTTQKQKSFTQELMKLIKMHQHIQGTVEEFRDCFSYLFFTQITTSAFAICGLTFFVAVSSHDNLILSTLFGFAIIYSIMDIYMVMYFGNEIKFASNHLSYCLFQLNWTDQSESTKKCIIILTEVLKKPQKMIILKLYPLDLETFTSILNLAYSMFNILRHIH